MKWPRSARKPRMSQPKRYTSPVGGWVANRNIAQPQEPGQPQAAAILDNFFPQASTVIMRRGCELHATLGGDNDQVRSLFKYVNGNNQRLFAANDTQVFDITTVQNPNNWRLGTSTDDDIKTDQNDLLGELSSKGLDVLSNQKNGNWSVVQFAVAGGGIFLRGVNGEDTPFVYDGSTFSTTPALTMPATETVVKPEDMSFVWAYKNRLFFVQQGSLNFWYLPVDQIGGELKKFPLGGIFNEGGSLLCGASWSLDSGSSGGLSEQCVFVSTEGEIAVFQGDNPADASAWDKVGVYKVGKPLGDKAIMRAGGDLIIATTTGFIPLSMAIQRDVAALSPAAVSYPIVDAWNDACRLRGNSGWHVMLWTEKQMVLVVPPHLNGSSPVMFVANALTGKWCRFTGWISNCMEVFQGQLYFGSINGEVIKANIGGSDKGNTYTAAYLPLFEDYGQPAFMKLAKLVRFTIRASAKLNLAVNLHTEYNLELSPAPNSTAVTSTKEWGTAIWGQSTWGASYQAILNNDWQSIGGGGYVLSPCCQVTSGYIVPLDAEIMSTDLTFEMTDVPA
ncbi:hypothetical protein [Brucella intermedia]|uniref:hypothetical protein n=1 Tax=Brucella intermedia TaxID=94625 RepID=UPI00124C464E|nr:hypothetical protein [Brucella intermedia]KAB2733631.1 hypothetical protein F9L02_01240 [Brucella intermedia]